MTDWRRNPARITAAAGALGTLAVAAACGGNTPAAPLQTGAVPAPSRPAALDGPWRVTSVVDGDTIRAVPAGGGPAIAIRLLGLDAPETKDPRKETQCFGAEASANLRQVLTGRTVDLEHGPERVDRYGRTLAYVWSGAQLVNLDLVNGGYAREYTYDRTPTAHTAALRAAEQAARAAGRGLWAPSGCNGATEMPR